MDEEKKKPGKDKNEKDLERKLKMDEIQEEKKHKINLEETIKTSHQSLINEAMACDTDHSHAVKAA